MSTSTSHDNPRAGFTAAGPLVEPSPRWIRVQFGGRFIADSQEAILLRQYAPGRLPTYYFPQDHIDMNALTANGREEDGRRYYDVQIENHLAKDGAWMYIDENPAYTTIQNKITFSWSNMDSWYEEEEEVFVHARDPYKRIDVMPSSRHVKVVINDQVVAESTRPYLLFETSLPTRYYLPQEDVHMEFLEPTTLQSQCPYKGAASYWSVKTKTAVAENIVWSYPDPIPESPKIKDLLCFYNEKVDLYIDGQLQERPRSPWS